MKFYPWRNQVCFFLSSMTCASLMIDIYYSHGIVRFSSRWGDAESRRTSVVELAKSSKVPGGWLMILAPLTTMYSELRNFPETPPAAPAICYQDPPPIQIQKTWGDHYLWNIIHGCRFPGILSVTFFGGNKLLSIVTLWMNSRMVQTTIRLQRAASLFASRNCHMAGSSRYYLEHMLWPELENFTLQNPPPPERMS